MQRVDLDSKYLEGTVDEGALRVVINRPERRNAWTIEMYHGIKKAAVLADRDPAIDALVLTGSGDVFCVGGEMAGQHEVGGRMDRETDGLDLLPFRQLESIRKIVVCAVNGPAVGGGMCLTLGADIRIAAESAYFRAAGITNGLTATELGVSFLLPRLIGASHAFEILLSGRDVTAAEAARIGLVSRTVADAALMDEVLSLAEKICGHSTHGVAMTKETIWANLETGSLEAAIQLENRNQLLVRLTTQNLEEAIRARRDKRKPVYED